MADQPGSQSSPWDTADLSRNLARIAERSQRLISDFMQRRHNGGDPAAADPLNIGTAFLDLTTRMMADPAKLVEAQVSLWQDYMSLWQETSKRLMGQEAATVAEPEAGDRRFRHDDWSENYVFDFIKQSYLLTARWMQRTVGEVEGLDAKAAQKVDFYTRQFVDAMAPSNFLLSNPEVLRATMESKGENLVRGLDNLIRDIEDGDGKLRIRMTDSEAFEVGRNVATTPGKVVFQNDLMQLIQYAPTTDKVEAVPLLIMPPWINKFYILDLQKENSFVRWLVDQGHTVFMVSWVNPDGKLGHKTFEDYMFEGPLAALDAIEKATGERRVSVFGYCLGGTLLAATLAYMAAKKDDRFVAATFMASQVDFSEAGELSVFIDEEQITALEAKMDEKGYLEGHEMATTFNMLRANDLIWSFVVHNYLMGKEPFPFDLLFWNSDSTRMPAAMHSFYLRKMYQENKLVEPGGITLGGVPIDLGTVTLPTYIMGSKEDHIAPWVSAYAATRIFKGRSRFVLAASGHIAGVVNPPAANKYCHWTNARKAKEAETWLKNATRHEGSWWPDWHKWNRAHGGEMVAARVPGDGKLKPIEDAPGTYVRVRSD